MQKELDSQTRRADDDAHKDAKDENEAAEHDALSVRTVRERRRSAGLRNVRGTREDVQSDHLGDGPARTADADVGLVEVLVRVLQLHSLADQAAEDLLPDLLVLEREAVRVLEPARSRVELLGRLEQARALRCRVREGVDVAFVAVFVVVRERVGRVRGSGREEQVAVRDRRQRGLGSRTVFPPPGVRCQLRHPVLCPVRANERTRGTQSAPDSPLSISTISIPAGTRAPGPSTWPCPCPRVRAGRSVSGVLEQV